MKRFISIFLSVCMVFFVLTAIPKVRGATLENPTLFHNDEPWFKEDRLKWYKIFFRYYVPISIFEKLDKVEIKENKKLGTVTMSYNSVKYVSFDINSNFAYTDENKQSFIMTYLFKDERYVPVEYVCEYFGFKFEVAENDAAIRISDNTTNKTLNDILLIYNSNIAETVAPETSEPETLPTTDVTEAPIDDDTLPQDTTTTEPEKEEIGERLIYLTFENSPNEYTNSILNLLNKYNCKATFFLEGDKMVENPSLVRKIMIDGHSIGLHTMTHNEVEYDKDFNVLLDEIKAENELLYKITKYKTRLFRAPNGSSTETFFINEENGKLIQDMGYIVWDWNVDVMDYETTQNVDRVVKKTIDGIKKYTIPVLRLQSNPITLKVLTEVLAFIYQHDQFKVIPITSTSVEVNFIGMFR